MVVWGYCTDVYKRQGQSDMVMAGVTVNEDRLEVMDFSDTYATGVQVVIVTEDSPIQTIDDLANAEMIGCQADTTGYIFCSYPPEAVSYTHLDVYKRQPMTYTGNNDYSMAGEITFTYDGQTLRVPIYSWCSGGSCAVQWNT